MGQPRLSDKLKVKTVLYGDDDEPIFFVSKFSNEPYLVLMIDKYGNEHVGQRFVYLAVKTTKEKIDKLQKNELFLYDAMLSNENYLITVVGKNKIFHIELKDKIDDIDLPNKGVYLHWQ